jgi:hypothetical protein
MDQMAGREEMTDTSREMKSTNSETERVESSGHDYEIAMQRALTRLKKGFHLGGTHKLDRDALHRPSDSH